MSTRRIVIIGGGFGGVTLAQQLERRLSAETEIVLLSSENHFVFTPLLAETAGREISPLHVVIPGRQMVRRTSWLTAEVTGIDPGAALVFYRSRAGEQGTIGYDHLAIACGSVVDFSGVPGLAEHAYPLRTLGDAVFLSNDLIGRLEEAAVTLKQEDRHRLLTVVVIGGGFSGVEIAGALNDLLHRARRFYPQLSDVSPRVVLLQRGDHLVPEFGAGSLSGFASAKLREHGVEVRLSTSALEITSAGVTLKSGEHLSAATVVCTVGNAPHPLLATLNLPLDNGRLIADPDLRVSGCENIWALGDCAVIPNARTAKTSPATAQFASRQAERLSRNLSAVMGGRTTRPFSFRPLGKMASIGRHKAVAEVLGCRISGFPAWLLWRAVYLAKMPTTVRKMEVAVDWARNMLFPPNVTQLQLNRTALNASA